MIEGHRERRVGDGLVFLVAFAFYAFLLSTLAAFEWLLWRQGGWWLLLMPVLAAATVWTIAVGWRDRGRRDVF